MGSSDWQSWVARWSRQRPSSRPALRSLKETAVRTSFFNLRLGLYLCHKLRKTQRGQMGGEEPGLVEKPNQGNAGHHEEDESREEPRQHHQDSQGTQEDKVFQRC